MKAVVLAGGKSSRMGQNKAMMQLGDRLVMQHVLDILSTAFTDIFISGNFDSYRSFQKETIADVISEKGPMGGIHAALLYTREDIFVCSCDMPFLTQGIIQEILLHHPNKKINVLKQGEKVYPTLGIYPFSVMPQLQQFLMNNQLKMTAALTALNANYVSLAATEGSNPLLNINTREAFNEAIQQLNRTKSNTNGN